MFGKGVANRNCQLHAVFEKDRLICSPIKVHLPIPGNANAIIIVGEDVVGTATFTPIDGDIELVVNIGELSGMFRQHKHTVLI